MLSRVANIIKIRFDLKTKVSHFKYKHDIFCFSFLDLVAQRGERLELLIDKTENLVDSVSAGYDDILQDVK